MPYFICRRLFFFLRESGSIAPNVNQVAPKVAENALIKLVSTLNDGLSAPKPATAAPIHNSEKNATKKPPKIVILSGPFVVSSILFQRTVSASHQPWDIF